MNEVKDSGQKLNVTKDSGIIPLPNEYDMGELNDLIEKAVTLNDTTLYKKVAGIYMMQHRETDLLYFSIVMAYKNRYARAYYNIYEIIAYSTPSEPKEALMILGNKTHDFAVYHLLKSYEMGYSDAKYLIDELFGTNKIIPSSSLYLKRYYDSIIVK